MSVAVQIPFYKNIDFSRKVCNNSGIVAGNNTAIISLFSGFGMRKKKVTVTIQDVAKTAARCCFSTVSRVFKIARWMCEQNTRSHPFCD